MKGLLLIIASALVLGTLLVANGAGAQEGESERTGEKFIAETAERLGVSAEQLTSAMTEAQFELIDSAVSEERLTEEQAAKLKERIEEYGPLSAIGLRQRHDGRLLCRGARLVTGAAAEVLGKEPAEVAAAVKAGESLAEQAEAQGMSVDEFKSALLEAVKATLQTKVDEGAITQAQADRIFAGIEQNIDRILNFEGDGEGRRACHHRGDDRPLRQGQP